MSKTEPEEKPESLNRPTVANINAILGKVYPVLDNGFVRIIDYMGNDEAIIQAARVSYGKGTKSINDDKGLLRYLLRHQHTTPFEMCLAGDVRVPTFPCEGAKVKHYTMQELANAFEKDGRENSWAKLIKIRTVNPITGVVSATKIKRAWKTGIKDVYEIVTEAPFNRRIRVTNNHPILTPSGFRSLDQGLAVGDQIMHNGIPALAEEVIAEIQHRRNQGQSIKDVAEALGVGQSTVFKYAKGRAARKTGFLKKEEGTHTDPRAIARRRLQLGECSVDGCTEPARDRHHMDENPHNNADLNLIGLCPKHHRHMHTMSRLEVAVPAKIVSITHLGQQEVYDLEVEDANHTFVAEGIVVHNCEIKLHVKLPVFVARQWVRHRMANINEYSARYSVMDREFYIPNPENISKQSSSNNQGREDQSSYTQDEISEIRNIIETVSEEAYGDYEYLISSNKYADEQGFEIEGKGLSRELGRMVLPMNIYTQWYWKTDLHNLFRFLKLRNDPHAQYEIRAYAEVVEKLVSKWVPNSYQAFIDYQKSSVVFSKHEKSLLASFFKMVPDSEKIVAGIGHMIESDTLPKDDRLSKREWKEFYNKLLSIMQEK